MKAISIGRDQGCDIVIQDNTDVISRRHATLNISPSGKMTIVDQSRNGTYVNGIRISSNVPVPVTRKDIVSFAHVAKLDWNTVPAENGFMRYLIYIIIIAIVIVCGIFAYQHFNNEESPTPSMSQQTAVQDSIKEKEAEKAKQDSLNAKKQEQEKKAKTDSIVDKKKSSGKKKTEKPKESNQETPKDSTLNSRPIG